MHSKALVQVLYNVGNMLAQRKVAAVYGKELAKLRKLPTLEDAIVRINALVTTKPLPHPILYIVENVANESKRTLLLDINLPQSGGWVQLAVITAEDDIKMPVIASIEMFEDHEYGSAELLHLTYAYEKAYWDSLLHEPDMRKAMPKHVELRYSFNLKQSSMWAELDVTLDALLMQNLFTPESIALLELAKVATTRP